ncbi:uncharacterized protein LOC143851197 [Tasmannia lanceolata]|uniref:uncharacterized protein LOC143851197 n=1 Tax=Tasmannia lanceolata TaxID=3420 RepID=UPI0040633F46
MEGSTFVWNYEQSVDELKDELLCTTLELDSIQMSAKEEKRRNEESTKHLLQLLKVAFQERNEARDQLQRLLNKIAQSSTTQLYHCLPSLQPENPAIITATKGNSSISESDSLSETYNHHSYVSSSPVDSFFDGVSSPDFSNINMAGAGNIGMTQNDPNSTIIDRLAMLKSLPEKGKLLQAVMGAGPILQTLLIAGPLPRWQKPPPIMPQIPPVYIKGHDNATLTPSLVANPNFALQSSLSPCVTKRPMLSSGADNDFLHNISLIGKRQKFQ